MLNQLLSWIKPQPVFEFGEDTEAFRITSRLPGLHEEKLTLLVFDDEVVLDGPFRRVFQIPACVQREEISLELSDNRLTILMPKIAGTPVQHNQRPFFCC